MSAFNDLHGKRFGRLTVDVAVSKNTSGRYVWRCICDCGGETCVDTSRLVSGKTRSCGCLKAERSTFAHMTHGMTGSRLYGIWGNMMKRCRNENDPLYGGRGISVCAEWHRFEGFYEWATKNGYNDYLTIDRIDTDGNYCPDNCRWATNKEQQSNKRNNRVIKFDGESHTLTEWADIKGLPLPTLWNRLSTLGWSVDRALTTPKKPGRCGS